MNGLKVEREERVNVWDKLDSQIVAISTWAATAFALVLFVVSVVTGELRPLALAVNPFVIATAGWVMIWLKKPLVWVQLTLGMLSLSLVSLLARDQIHHPLLGIMVMGTVGVLVLRRRAIWFGLAASVLTAGVAYMHEVTASGAERIQIAVAAAATTAFIAVLVWWVKSQWLATSSNLEELLASKDQLVASVSHELRTPMTSVVGLARELDERYEDFAEEEIRELISLIVHESTDVANILEDLLVAARADVGGLALVHEPIDLYSEISAALVTASSATINRHHRTEPLLAWADPGRVRQILRNLVVNATRYGGPDVRVVVNLVGSEVAISVCDDGDPIPMDQRKRIFMPYVGVAGSASVPGSVGLGLTVSRQLARLMGGDLVYDHTGDESKFTLSLPLYQPRASTAPRAAVS